MPSYPVAPMTELLKLQVSDKELCTNKITVCHELMILLSLSLTI